MVNKDYFYFDIANINIISGVPQGGSELTKGREDAYSGKLVYKIIFFVNFFLDFLEQLSVIPEFAHLGPIFKSSLPVHLTESEVKYVVRCIKHVFSHYIVFQVNIFCIYFFFIMHSTFSLI